MAKGQSVTIKEISLNKIKLGRNSRLSNSKEDLSGLMQSINSTGLLEPIGVIKSPDGDHYEIAYGNRRFMAFSRLGLHSIPAVVHKFKNKTDVDVKNLAENVQRRNISLAEVGRYASILEGEGLSKKELAVRLGAPLNYIQSCLDAYKEVPKEYRDDLQPRLNGQALEPGKISIDAARSILSAKKGFGLDKDEIRTLFKAAKEDERFEPKSVPKYVAAIKRGRKDPIGSVRQMKSLCLRLMIDEHTYDKLIEKHVTNGPFNSFTALIKAVLRGQKQVMINFLD